MNHIYRSIWSEALGTWIAVSELATGKHKTPSQTQTDVYVGSPSTPRSANKMGFVPQPILPIVLLAACSNVYALPTGDQLIAGQATVATPTATQMQINQASDRAVINWQGFSVGQHEAVHIQQPHANAALLNRVVGQDASQIQGKIQANGQVYLVNPNGVMFSKTAQIDVGGLIASTHDINNADFMAGKHHFSQTKAGSKVENHGTINTAEGGVVALIGEQITNTGTINTPKGNTALVAGKTVDLDMTGDGLVEVKVTEAALNAQIQNHGAITADGGRVVMTAKAANTLMDTVINQNGIVKARGLTERNGEIILDGGEHGAVKVSGTINASGEHGGKVGIVGKEIQLTSTAAVEVFGEKKGGLVKIGNQSTQLTTLNAGSRIHAGSLENGNAGQVEVFANMQQGLLTVQGQIDASAKHGDGGFVETSAAKVKIADTANINTRANQGKNGTWLIDPNDFTIAAVNGDISGATLSSNLGGGNVTIFSTLGATSGNGDIHVNDVVTWSNNILTLEAQRNININVDMNASGSARLTLKYGMASSTGGVNDNYFINNGAKVNLPKGFNFYTQKGSAGSVIGYQVITELGTLGSTTSEDLQGINNNIYGNYVLGKDIDASATANWTDAAGVGFKPLSLQGCLTMSIFDGLGHTISKLTINRPTIDNVGLFGSTSVSNIRNVGLIEGSIIGGNNVGALVGWHNGIMDNTFATSNVRGLGAVGGLVGFYFGDGSALGTGNISHVYATGSVTGTADQVGGLIGWNNGVVDNAYAMGSVIGVSKVGGLIGQNNNSITNAYAVGNVTTSATTGVVAVGGLVGQNNGFIGNTYATGSVGGSVAPSSFGGLVGELNSPASISNSFWDTQTTGQTNAFGLNTGGVLTNVVGKTSAEMKTLSTFSSAGWDISGTGGSTKIWRIYEGYTAPLLRHWLIPLTINAFDNSKTYNGLSDSTLVASYSIPNAPTSGRLFNLSDPYNGAKNVGVYNMVKLPYSNQQGYDISINNAILTINPAVLTVTPTPNQIITYGDATPSFTPVITNFVNGEDVNSAGITGSALFNINGFVGNVGSYDVSYAGGFSSQNYIFSDDSASINELTVQPKLLQVIPNPQTVIYGSAISFTPSFTGFVNGDNALTAGIVGTPVFDIANFAGNVGVYNVSYLNGLSSLNYLFADDTASINELTVLPATLWVTPNSQTMLFGSRFKPFQASFTGFKLNDTVQTAGIIGNPEFKIDGFTGAAGRYNVRYVTGLQSQNYVFADNVFSTNELTVLPVKSELFESQSTPLQRATTFIVQTEKEPAQDTDLIDTKNEGVKLPAKLHRIISLFLSCSR